MAIKKGLLADEFTISIASAKKRMPNFAETTDVVVTLGSDKTATQYQNCYFKDLRVWTSKRSTFELFTYRFK